MIKVNEEARRLVLKDLKIQDAICEATGKGHSTVLRWLYKANAEKLSQMIVSDIVKQRTGLNIVDYAASQR
jgi:hypothetical protein